MDRPAANHERREKENRLRAFRPYASEQGVRVQDVWGLRSLGVQDKIFVWNQCVEGWGFTLQDSFCTEAAAKYRVRSVGFRMKGFRSRV